jgi:6-phosphogluconolactonase (cycloisomerase 2 family)
MKSKQLWIVLAALLTLGPAAAFGAQPPVVGAVYAMSNAPEGNTIFAYDRDLHGRLTLADTYVTAGLGSGGNIDPLGSQGSLILSANQRWLIAVNAGSNDISVFRVLPRELELVGNFDSGGPFPSSLTLHRNLLYVLNAGQSGNGPNITSFTLNRHGALKPLPDSTRALGPGGFHQVGFNPRGDALVVTQGDPAGVNAIHVFAIDEDGLADAAPTTSPSAGVVPFSFIFDWRGHLLVTEAGSGAVSSYGLRPDNTLAIIDASVPNGNSATCWIAGTWFGGVFTSNTGSDNISSYKVKAIHGRLSLREANAASGNKPIDMAVTPSGRFLYVLNAGEGSIGAFRISGDGSLSNLGTVTGLPPVYAQGIAVR